MASDHSSSSHSSDSGGGFFSGGGSYSGSDNDMYYAGGSMLPTEDMFTTVRRSKPRIRASRPAKGYYSFRCVCGKKHDYRFFESDWKDKRGVEHNAGWYDERNNRYDGATYDNSTGAACICGKCKQRSTISIYDHNITQ
ncbi:MAG: hypothetical protein J5802_11700 [Butyrivibrio sp.]|nr:hypothetical protein [Butyrivibrio sp.]